MTPRSLSRLKILVADDNALLRRGLQEMLSLWGVGRVVVAADGTEARAILSREPIDLVVTDWIMAPVDGAALVHWIRHAADSPRRDLPVIVLTARADVPTVRAAWDIGADAVLAKPVSAVVIARRIEAVLRRPRRPPPAPAPAASAGHPPEPPGAALFPTGPARSSDRDASPAERERRLRLLIALDRLEGVLERRDLNLGALRVVTADLQHAASGDAVMEEIVRSLARCVTQVDPFVPAFFETLKAHHAGLRWIVLREEADRPAVDRSLAVCLAAGVDSLIERHAVVEGTRWEAPEAPRGPRGARLLG